MNTYLPINKFVICNSEFGSRGPFGSIRDENIIDFEDFCLVNAEKNPHTTIYGISRIMFGKEINEILGMGNDNILYSYYDKETNSRSYFKAYSINPYILNNEKQYRIEVNITNDSFNIFRIDEE